MLSHVSAQASGLGDFLSAPTCTRVFSTNIFDDASMWVAKAEVEKHIKDIKSIPKRLQEKLESRGKNCHMPVLNLCENLFCEQSREANGAVDHFVCGSEVASPAQVLPLANAPTVTNRWEAWTVLQGSDPGIRVDVGGVLAPKLETPTWKTVMIIKDNLALKMHPYWMSVVLVTRLFYA